MLITDLDGTLLTNSNTITNEALELLHKLGGKNIPRIIATGRSYFSLKKVLNADFPIDYLIFSSGAGLMRWSDKKILFSDFLNSQEINNIIPFLNNIKVDFCIHEKIPDNHKFIYKKNTSFNPDFDKRCILYSNYAQNHNGINPKVSAQIIIIGLPDESEELFLKIKNKFSDLSVIRATSPLDNKSVWVEIFPKNISKSHTAERLRKILNMDKEKIMVIGNDYNDLDILDFYKHSYVVKNSPDFLKNKFQVVASNDNNGFCEAVLDFFQI